MNTQHLQINFEESHKVNRNQLFNSRTLIAAACIFFGSMSVAMADACSQKQLDDGCKNQTSSTGYKWCKCDPKSFKKGSGSLIDGAGSEPGGSLGNQRPPNARVEGSGFK